MAKLFEQGGGHIFLHLFLLLSFCSSAIHLSIVLIFFLIKLSVPTVGLHKILSLLEAEDVDVRIHAVKVVANLAAEGN